MTLKELRISKGLNQKECAEYLGVGVRTYQNYENDGEKVGSAKYNALYYNLQQYGRHEVFEDMTIGYFVYNTNVVTGRQLLPIYEKVKEYRKRECYSLLKQYLEGGYEGKICILYGLRRTGKTTMLFQLLGDLPVAETAYIKVQPTDNMAKLTKDLQLLYKSGCRYVFIDEITLLEDFVNTAAVLSDVFTFMGLKIIVSGTDSLGFAMANRDELYNRCIMVHTSFIPFREYERLLGICSVDQYIEYGGTLRIENMGFDDPHHDMDDVSFRDDESTRKYIDTAISRNIQHALKCDHDGANFGPLRTIYEQGELTNVINRIVENLNHEFLVKTIEEKFKSHDYGSAKDLLLHDAPKESAYILYNADREAVTERLKAIISIKEKEETKVAISAEHIEKVKKYLLMLDLIINCPDVYEDGSREDHYLFTQPGMRYSIAKALVYALIQDEYFRSASEEDKRRVTQKILEDVKGKLLEEIVLLETTISLQKDQKVFKYYFTEGGEYDMVLYDGQSNTCKVFEIKHSDKMVDRQRRFLEDPGCCAAAEKRFGRIAEKIVLYRGESCEVGEVRYQNVEEYLMGLGK